MDTIGVSLGMLGLGIYWTFYCVHGINFLSTVRERGVRGAIHYASEETAVTFYLRRYPVRHRINWQGKLH